MENQLTNKEKEQIYTNKQELAVHREKIDDLEDTVYNNIQLMDKLGDKLTETEKSLNSIIIIFKLLAVIISSIVIPIFFMFLEPIIARLIK